MFVMALAVAIIFIGLILQLQFVPFKRKFHNIMEYFILIATLIVLVCGLLFIIPIEKFPSEGFRKFIDILALVVIITSTVFVVGMILWDANTRKKNDKKRLKRKKKENEALIEERRRKGLRFDDLVNIKKTQYDANGKVVFKTPFFDESSESDEDTSTSMNQILEDLFGLKRIRRKLFLINRKRTKLVTVKRRNVKERRGNSYTSSLNNNTTLPSASNLTNGTNTTSNSPAKRVQLANC